MKNQKLYVTALAGTLAAALAACSSTPPHNAALDQARVRFNAAEADPQVATLAPEELKRAGESLHATERAWSDGSKKAGVDQLAYMTSQRVSIAQETASSRAAQAVTAGAGAERDRMRLAQRTSEADTANQKLAMAQQSNAQKTAELADAGRRLTQSQQSLDQSEQSLALSRQSDAQKAADLAAAGAAAQRDQDRNERSDARVSDLEGQLSQLKDLNAKQTDRGMVVTLGDVLFDSGKSVILAGGARNMGKLADFFKRNPERSALIEGYTDSVGSANANNDLSARRANAVMTALVDLGVPAGRLATRAYGSASPVASNSTAAGRQLNRRVEIVFAAPADTSTTK